jgi:prostaglandin-endoperoxide synthase 2
VLFAHFAQWFTDGLLRTDRDALEAKTPLLKNTSNHEIDLCNLYGMNREQTDLLRLKRGGLLRSQLIRSPGDDKEEEWPPYYGNGKFEPFPEFERLPKPLIPMRPPLGPLSPDRLETLFALGTERGNVTPGYLMMNVLFLREHNRVARVLQEAYPGWDDDRLFETTRNILIHLLLTVVIEDYINHIAPYHFKFKLVGGTDVNRSWYRTNWVAIEFNLLYRWHALVPDYVYFGDAAMPSAEAFYRNQPLLEAGMRTALEGATRHRAGHIGLFNTPDHLIRTEKASVMMARMANLASYNDYRDAYKFPRATQFEQISSDPRVVKGLRDVYGRVDNVELYVGLFAEDVRENSILAQLMGRMVGVDAFSQALTNPLLAKRVYSPRTFSEEGLHIIRNTRTLNDIVSRNVTNPPKVSFTHHTWTRS